MGKDRALNDAVAEINRGEGGLAAVAMVLVGAGVTVKEAHRVIHHIIKHSITGDDLIAALGTNEFHRKRDRVPS